MSGRKQPETDRQYYTRRFSEIGRKAFEVAAGALFFWFVDWVLHTLLTALGIPKTSKPGAIVHTGLDWITAVAYFVLVLRLLLPDASDQSAEMPDEIHERWHKSGKPGKRGG